jgi:hypothetical protein
MASYPKPTNTGSTFNSSNWIAPTINSADSAYLNANYCQFPTLQGAINTKNLTTTGSIGVSSNIVMNGVSGVNYIQFPDGTKQTTATQDFSGYAFTDVSNNFSKLNTFNGNLAIGGVNGVNYIQYPDGTRQYTAPAGDDINTVYNDVSNTFLNGTIQTFQGSNSTTNITAPLQFSNVSTGEYGSLFVDPSPSNDLTLYSNQSSNAGLTVRNPSFSFTINPTNGNTATFLNPISSNYRITGNGLTTTSNLIFPDTTTQTTAFTSSLLSPYAPLFSPSFTGNPTTATTPQNTALSAVANVNYVNNAVAGSIPVLTNYAQLTTSSAQTFTGSNNFTGGLQKNGVGVATVAQLPVITASTLSITGGGGNCTLNFGSFQQAVQTYYSNSGASLGTFLNYPIQFTINSYVPVGNILVVFSFSTLPYPAYPPTNPAISIIGTTTSGLAMPMDGQLYISGTTAMCTLFMPYNFGTGSVVGINFASLGNLVG